ncbi:MAG TPA: hypothetical protein VLT17_04840 [Gemmatimonadales bacterium]|nr:hypothetical protein [Gemmatimonadales bacterium]
MPPWQGGLTASLGQPSRTSLYAGAGAGIDWREDSRVQPLAQAVFGVSHFLGNPVVGRLAVAAEGYAGSRADHVDGGARFLLQIPVLRISVGGDYNIRDARLGFTMGLTLPIRRGGVLRGGSLLRVDWSPQPLAGARVSVLVPVRQPRAGRTRPRSDRVNVTVGAGATAAPAVDIPGLSEALGNVDIAAQRIERLVVPDLDRAGADPRAGLAPLFAELHALPPLPGTPGPGLDVDGVVRIYHAELIRAFSIAASGQALELGATTPEGELAAAKARQSLLDHLLYPYNRLLGQWKTRTTVTGLAAYARGDYAREVVSLTSLPAEREAALLYVFERLLQTVVGVEHDALERWGDSRLIWLPLQFAFRPEEHATQAQLDRIVQDAVGVNFTDGNRVWYIINEQFQAEVVRSIEKAEEYHVLWIHDFAGRNDAGLPDPLTLQYVVDAYLQALIQRLRQYDTRRRLPVYMVFIDQHYYEDHDCRLWLDVLDHPLDATPRLPRGSEAMAARIRAAQEDLREAVAGSRLLQAEVRQYGNKWLRNLVKVQVNVTNPADQSFWSRQIIPLLGVPDNIMRDHRKIVFYDVTEEDPYRGMAIYTGMGIGEHYTGQTWEDRAIMVQGPALLSLKAQARRLLESQGIAPDRIPFALRPRALAAGYRAAIDSEIAALRNAGERDQRAMELHNETGFLAKQVTVARAVLYSLMPPGSLIKVPDSLWGNGLSAALLTGSAFRGCRVLFVAPSLAAAPSAGWPQMALTHHLFGRLIVLQQEFGPELEAAGGMLKTGIYNPGIGVQKVSARFAAAYLNARRTPFLRRLLPVDERVDTLLAHAREIMGAEADSAPGVHPAPVMPKLHLKATFFASREGWDRLVAQPEITEVVAAYMGQLLRRDSTQSDVRQAAAALAAASYRLETAFQASLTPEERDRVMYYLLIGSANQDYRSMVMDGEASVLLSGWSGVVGLIDFSLIISLSVWIDDLEMLDALLPPPSGMQRSVARMIRPML